MWPSRDAEKSRIAAALQAHTRNVRALPGIVDSRALDTLVMQFIASLRREAYYKLLQQKPISATRADPSHPNFNPERAVAYHLQSGNVDEAAWLIFLMTHFGRPANTGWRRLQDVYGRLGNGVWDWIAVSAKPGALTAWLAANWQAVRGKFGNHRKYESLRPDANRNTAQVIESYVAWIGPSGHRARFEDIVHRAGNDPHTIFKTVYDELPVIGFGRLAKFDYLSMIGRYGIAPMEPGSAYLDGATGPAKGAQLLFSGQRQGPATNEDLQKMLDTLDIDLQVGMKVMEDALCNWQKKPLVFEHFKG
ncbi:MAG: hypothetical protein NVS2B5_21850 [Beijerinckiaceae bacterium]